MMYHHNCRLSNNQNQSQDQDQNQNRSMNRYLNNSRTMDLNLWMMLNDLMRYDAINLSINSVINKDY